MAGGPFRGNPALASRAGKIGGAKSRRGPAKPKAETFFVKDAQIDNHIIEPFQKQRFWQGWFKSKKENK